MERMRAPVAVHILMVRDGEVLLLRRFDTGYEDGNFSVPAGHLDGNETVIEAGIREAREETGVVVEPAQRRIVQVMHRFAEEERIDYFVVVDHWSGNVSNREPEKCDLLDWFPMNSLPGNMVPYVRFGIENWRKGVLFTTFGASS